MYLRICVFADFKFLDETAVSRRQKGECVGGARAGSAWDYQSADTPGKTPIIVMTMIMMLDAF